MDIGEEASPIPGGQGKSDPWGSWELSPCRKSWSTQLPSLTYPYHSGRTVATLCCPQSAHFIDMNVQAQKWQGHTAQRPHFLFPPTHHRGFPGSIFSVIMLGVQSKRPTYLNCYSYQCLATLVDKFLLTRCWLCLVFLFHFPAVETQTSMGEGFIYSHPQHFCFFTCNLHNSVEQTSAILSFFAEGFHFFPDL